MNTSDWFELLHPFLAVVLVYPLLGIVTLRAWQTRQRRLEIATQKKSKIAPAAGTEHVQIGKILSGSVVGLALLGITYAIFSKAIANQFLSSEPLLYLFIGLLLIATIASLVMLYRAKPPLWRGIFATLTGDGLSYFRQSRRGLSAGIGMVLVALLLRRWGSVTDDFFPRHCPRHLPRSHPEMADHPYRPQLFCLALIRGSGLYRDKGSIGNSPQLAETLCLRM